MALTENIVITARDGRGFSDPMAADAVIYQGALVVLNAAGNAIPGTTIAGGAAVTRGVAVAGKSNTGGAIGAERIETRRGCFRFKNSASTDAITKAEIGDQVFVVDDETVAKTSNTNARIVAGICRDVDAAGVWVEI